MNFEEVLDQAIAMLQRRGRVTYRVLKRQFALDDEALDDLKFELIEGQEVAADKDGKMLVWIGGETSQETASQTVDAPTLDSPSAAPIASSTALLAQPEREAAAGERRQLTVMFCDLVGSTALSQQLDPEELHQMIRAYQHTCAQVITRYEGHIAQYLGDGLLVYFGFPAAHEDDASRAVRTSLEILSHLRQLDTARPLHVRIGIHTGHVMVGEVGEGDRREQLAVGETPNMAARVQGQAEPDEVVISAATQQLVAGLFETEDCGLHELKGIATPQSLYRVRTESVAQNRFDVAVQRGLTPLVGRETEVEFLHQRWGQAQAGNGQAVLVSGEPGIGKSRLVQELKAQVTQAGATQREFRCSPYHQNSALYPVIEHLQRLLQLVPDETPQTKLAKLQQQLGRYRFPQADTLPLIAALLSLPHPAGVPPLTASPQKQKEQTLAALVAWLLEETERQPVYNSWEDLHWADPSTLEMLDLVLRQVPTMRVLVVLTFRPEFVPPWGTHSYLSQLTLSRLGQPQVNAMVDRVTGGKALPEEVVQQIVTKTDGVPLFVEELTKMVLESNFVRAVNSHYELTGPLPPLAIPSTLQDSLMARLDRLATVREIAQLGATIGREFGYDLLHAVSPLDAAVLQHGLQQLVEAELVFQHGLPPEARYMFKHALIQDTAYESLLKSTRQQLHEQVAQVLQEQFPETVETQPELVAYHYTEAGLVAQAIPYWHQAGQRTARRSANVEAVGHLTTALELLQTLPATPERSRQELTGQLVLGPVLISTKGWAASEVETTYTRARDLCQQLGETSQLFSALSGLSTCYIVQAELQRAHELGEQLLSLAHSEHDPALLVEAHRVQGITLACLGDFALSREHSERGFTFYDPQQHSSLAFSYGQDPGVFCLANAARALWPLGYPDQALKRSHEALSLAQRLSHPFSLSYALFVAVILHLLRGEGHAAQERAEALLTFSTEQRLLWSVGAGTILGGWALAEQGEGAAGIAQMRQGLAARQAMGAVSERSLWLALLAEAYGKVRQTEEGLSALVEALHLVDKTDERWWEAELWRLKGELTLQQFKVQGSKLKVEEEAEACFHKALAVARQQQAKSWELRAATSLARVWQQHGKKSEARELLAPVYHWFTEGFDTADLKDAKALLET